MGGEGGGSRAMVALGRSARGMNGGGERGVWYLKNISLCLRMLTHCDFIKMSMIWDFWLIRGGLN